MIILDSLVLVFGLLGAILIAKQNRLGFICFIIHSFSWGILSYLDANIGAVLTCIAFIVIDIWGYWRWREVK